MANLGWGNNRNLGRDASLTWLGAVMGYYGGVPTDGDTRCEIAEPEYEIHDRQARAEWVSAIGAQWE